jgi:hypothetical protein
MFGDMGNIIVERIVEFIDSSLCPDPSLLIS